MMGTESAGSRVKDLVIVESPAKARTIGKYLGDDAEVRASLGHIKDLPKKRFGIDVKNGFRIEYVTLLGKRKVLQELRRSAERADRVLLAADPDREGEIICWHLAEELRASNERIHRILFNEITPAAIRAAAENPGEIDERKVDAQKARRVLDRIVGYKLSPLLWEKVRRGLSAGRVQSVALRAICEREREIAAFEPREYWLIHAQLRRGTEPPFRARLEKRDGTKLEIPDQAAAEAILRELDGAQFTVTGLESRIQVRKPPAPYITSTLQQDAIRRLGLTAERCMRLAQGLYEGKELGDLGHTGLITYMRTDSPRLSEESMEVAREVIRERFGAEFLPGKPRQFKSKGGAQDAHEAIRPTNPRLTPEQVKPYLSITEYKLYNLIWTRFIASQMASARLRTVTVEVSAGRYAFVARGVTIVKPGFLALVQEPRSGGEESEENGGGEPQSATLLPDLAKGEELRLVGIEPQQKFTRPPPRYTEASLVRWLEEKGIGRPSTYASILRTIRDRNYVSVVEKKFHATEMGMVVCDLLVQHFPTLLDPAFTARMEAELDRIEEGKQDWKAAVVEFYEGFIGALEQAEETMPSLKGLAEPTGEACPECGAELVIKLGPRGRFLGCSAWPTCRYTRNMGEDPAVEEDSAVVAGRTCPKCQGKMVVRTGRFGRFLACARYPECDHSQPYPLGIPCPEEGCSGELLELRGKRGRLFYGCSRYPECNFRSWQRPMPEKCPQCGYPFLVRARRKGAPMLRCPRKGCGFTKAAEPE
jgi:DNA topoisomerase-1